MRNIGFRILYVVTAFIIVVNLFFTIKESIFTDINQLPCGTIKNSIVSPEGNRTLNIYIVQNNLGVAIRGEIYTDDGAHNIFWQTGIDTVEAAWLNNSTVVINEIPLDANDTFGYDCRRGYSLFDEGSLEQNFTNFRGINEKE